MIRFYFSIFIFCLFFRALAQKESEPLQDSLAQSLEKGKFQKAIGFGNQLVEKYKKEGKTETLEWARMQSNLSVAFSRMQQFKEAENAITSALVVNQKLKGKDHLVTGRDLFTLANIYAMQGINHKADSLYQIVLPIYSASLPEDDMEMAKLYINFGSAAMQMMDIPKAEQNLLKGIKIAEAKDSLNPNAANGHNNLSKLYGQLGNEEKNLFHQLKAIQILEKGSRGGHPLLGIMYSNLAATYGNINRYDLVEKYAKLANIKLVATFGERHPLVAINYYFLGTSSMMKYNFFEAFHLFKKTEKLLESGELDKGQWLMVYYGSLSLNGHMGNALAVDSIFKKAQNLIHKTKEQDILGMDRIPLYFNQGTAQRILRKTEAAEPNFKEADKLIQKQLVQYFPYLSDQGKAEFLRKLSDHIEGIKSYYFSRIASKPVISADLYDSQLATKALLLNSAAKWKQRIKTSGDLKLIQMFTRWTENQNYLSKLLKKPEEAQKKELDSCLALNESLEKELSRRSENFARLSEKAPVTWKQVQSKLKPGEAAAEVIRLKAWGLAKTITDTSDPKKTKYPIYTHLDSSLYAVLLVKPGLPYPELVLLPKGKEMEGKGLAFYRNCVEKQLPDKQSYNLFWKAIGSKLNGIRRIYFSPEGVYHSINLNTLQNPQTGKYLMDEMEISQVTSTKDLVLPRKEEELNQLAYLFGYPNYNTSLAIRSAEAGKQRNSPELAYRLNKVRGEGFAELPGTKAEVESISSILKEKGWEVNTLEGNQALEETLKESLKPRVLHLATHGFFEPDTTRGSNPLLHSGLLLTGANRTLAGEKPDQGEDGILTAYEAMNLNLDNTDLVVLSACETGLGEIKNGEGVYGLQRAFKVAGAKSIIMSLWKVDDEATQELMVGFYKNWLGPQTPKGGLNTSSNSSPLGRSGGAGSKRAAFLKAQKELKAKYPNPYYWGAFVMVGE